MIRDIRSIGEVQFRDESRRLYQDGKYGFLDADGKTVIVPKFEKASDFSEGVAAVAVKDGDQLYWGFIGVDGNMVIEPKSSERPDDFHDGCAVVRKKNGKYVYIDRTGAAISPEFVYATRFMSGYVFSSTTSTTLNIKGQRTASADHFSLLLSGD